MSLERSHLPQRVLATMLLDWALHRYCIIQGRCVTAVLCAFDINSALESCCWPLHFCFQESTYALVAIGPDSSSGTQAQYLTLLQEAQRVLDALPQQGQQMLSVADAIGEAM